MEAVLELESSLQLQRKAIAKLETALAVGADMNVSDISMRLRDAREHCTRLEDACHRKQAALGIDGRVDLMKLRQDFFLRLRMNALALKQRIRDRLRQRKFEIEKLERSYRRNANGMCTLNLLV